MRRLWRLFWKPSARYGVGALLVVGGLGGVIFWGGFNTAMEATNTMSFCITCHEMRDTVYQEYKETVHYQNASGVRAICSDCHVPDPWVHKVVRKVQATQELYHKAVGTISTPEKFEDHRATMAKRVWATMEANDSQECRNCHSFEAMAFDKQSKEASERMQEAHQNGETCIACHKGIAHKLPDLSSSYKTMYADLETLAQQQGADAEAVYTIRSQPAYLTAEAVGSGGRGAGTLLPATELQVLGSDGDAIQVRLAGWQQDRVDRVIYARMGHRIFSAALRPDVTDQIQRHETTVNQDTEQTWHRVTMDMWIAADGAIKDEQKLWAYGAEMHNASCSVCHSLQPPDHHLANQWIGVLKSMERFIVLDKEQQRFLQKYLQLHASDVSGDGGHGSGSDG